MSGLPNIRDYIEEDYEAVLQVWQETSMGGAERGDDDIVIQRTLQQGGWLRVMEYDGEIIGTSWLTNDGRRIYLHHFGIRPRYQGRSWAHLLLKDSLELVKKSGMQVKLEVHRDNTKAVELYQKAGFAYLGDYDVYIVREPRDLASYLVSK